MECSLFSDLVLENKIDHSVGVQISCGLLEAPEVIKGGVVDREAIVLRR